MKLTKQQLKKFNIGYTGSNFEAHFMGMEFTLPKKPKLTFKVLEKPMTVQAILSKLKPEETTLGEFLWAIKNHKKILDDKNHISNIFYIRDKQNTLWAVFAFFYAGSGYWYANAFSVEDPDAWDAGHRMVSGKFGSELGNSDSRHLESARKIIAGIENQLAELKRLIK